MEGFAAKGVKGSGGSLIRRVLLARGDFDP